jgi:peroxiredoxin
MKMRNLRLAGASLLVPLGIWAGFSVYTSHAPGRSGQTDAMTGVRVPLGAASPTVVSAAGPPDGDTPKPPRIPERLPDFSLADRTGKATSIASWRGKSLIINFWATWCAPCRHEIPLLLALDSEWRDRDVEVVGIAVDRREKVLAYADKFKITYPLLIGEDDALDVVTAFGVESPGFPFSVFTDRQGDVVTLYLGELHRDQADFILKVVQRLNQNQVPLAEARRSIAEYFRVMGHGPQV